MLPTCKQGLRLQQSYAAHTGAHQVLEAANTPTLE